MPLTQPSRRVVVAAGVGVAAALHALTPAGPHAWHWLHLVAGKLYFLPILLSAAWFGARATAGVTLAVSALSAAHIARDWAGFPMVQAEELAEIATFWLVGLVSAALFRREREAREATIADGRGSQFDPDAADAFLRIPFEAWARVAATTGVTLRRCVSSDSHPPGPIGASSDAAAPLHASEREERG